ncbi:hypothetical protein [Anaerofustis stercorihominis]|uniref:hypothetical protein n=1 Tax=Anaerofustis stercorihominis TaxID=214853 RepID=UPI002670E455|nr:hypothetical protein [Anaerofustis stercorihominis]
MTVNYYFFDSIIDEDGKYSNPYSSSDFSRYLNKIVGNGVFPNPSTQLQVVAGGGMDIIVKAGEGWVNGHKIYNDRDLVFTLPKSDVLLGRVDRIVFYEDNTNLKMDIIPKTGTISATPTPPELTRNESIYEMCLAEITVNKQVTEITQADIRDTRGLSDICGYVQGLIQQVGTQTLFDQWNTAYDNAIDTDTAAFNDWFNNIKDTLLKSTLVRAYENTYISTSDNVTVIPIGLTNYNKDLDILNVFINGFKLISGIDYSITSATEITLTLGINANTPVNFQILKCVDGSDAESIVTTLANLEERVQALENA